MKQTWAAPERNKQPILDVLKRTLPARDSSTTNATKSKLLEIASGSGQHAVFFATQFPGWTWQPSDIDPDNLASIAAWVSETALPNLLPPIRLDVCDADWNVPRLNAVYCANMIHIAPWECCVGLIRGAGKYLAPNGHLIVYGPFRIHGEHTSESNATFDASLKSRNPAWGVRDLEAVSELAAQSGFTLTERIAMPANNQTLVFTLSARSEVELGEG